MSTSSSSKRRHFWRSDWFVGACVVGAVLVLSTPCNPLERSGLPSADAASIQGSRQPSDLTAVVAKLGAWVPQAHAGALSHAVAAPAHADAEMALVMAAAAVTVEGAGLPTGYDPAAKAAAADDPFAKTAVFSRPGRAAHRPRDGGHRGSET